MVNIKTYSPSSRPTVQEQMSIAKFLHQHLEQYGDPQTDIDKAIDYALQKENTPVAY